MLVTLKITFSVVELRFYPDKNHIELIFGTNVPNDGRNDLKKSPFMRTLGNTFLGQNP